MAYKFHGEAPQGARTARRQDHPVHRASRRLGPLSKAALLACALIALLAYAAAQNPKAPIPACVDIKSPEACGETHRP